MRNSFGRVVFGVVGFGLVVAGCDRKPAKQEAPAPPAAASPAAAPPAGAAAGKLPDTHPAIAKELLAGAEELNTILIGIGSEADATAAAAKLSALADRHEALANQSQSLLPPTKETDAAIKAEVQPTLQRLGRAIADHMERFEPVPGIGAAVMPHIERIGQAAQVVARTSHVNGRPVDRDGGGEATTRYAAWWREQFKDVPVPPNFGSDSPVSRLYVANVAPIFRQYGAANVKIVRFNQVSTTDRAFLPLITAAAKSLGLTASIPTVLTTGRTTTDVYVAVSPATDAKEVGTKFAGVFPNATAFPESDKGFISINTVSSTEAQNQRSAKLAELGGTPLPPRQPRQSSRP
jgi:hypothetical protein